MGGVGGAAWLHLVQAAGSTPRSLQPDRRKPQSLCGQVQGCDLSRPASPPRPAQSRSSRPTRRFIASGMNPSGTGFFPSRTASSYSARLLYRFHEPLARG